jgi:beta-alanine degradation protein BauB
MSIRFLQNAEILSRSHPKNMCNKSFSFGNLTSQALPRFCCYMVFRASIPAVATVLIDDATSRVTRWDFEPGASTGFHSHGLDYIVVPMTDCNFLIEDKDGERRVFVARGAAYARQKGIEHNVINGGAEPMSFIEVEVR